MITKHVRTGQLEIQLPTNHNDKEIEEKRYVTRLFNYSCMTRGRVHCPFSAEIGAADDQSDSRILVLGKIKGRIKEAISMPHH